MSTPSPEATSAPRIEDIQVCIEISTEVARRELAPADIWGQAAWSASVFVPLPSVLRKLDPHYVIRECFDRDDHCVYGCLALRTDEGLVGAGVANLAFLQDWAQIPTDNSVTFHVSNDYTVCVESRDGEIWVQELYGEEKRVWCPAEEYESLLRSAFTPVATLKSMLEAEANADLDFRSAINQAIPVTSIARAAAADVVDPNDELRAGETEAHNDVMGSERGEAEAGSAEGQ